MLIDISTATVGITLFIYALKLWEFFDLEYEKAYEHLTKIQKCQEIHENDQVLLDARKAHEIILDNFGGSRRLLWMWFPGFLLLLLFFLVTFLPSLALTELPSGLELWVVIYFVAVFIPVFGAMYGARGRPIVKYRRARDKFPSCFKEDSDSKRRTVKESESSSQHAMIEDMKTLTTSELLSFRSDFRADIRSLDDLNFKIISIIGTVSFAIMTAGTALGEMDYLVFFFAGIAIVNYMAAVMLFKNRISVLEKTWYVCYLESRLPEEYRRFWPFGFKHFDEPLPKGAAYRSMISVHQMLIILGFFWALASLHTFSSQHYVFANAIASIHKILGQPVPDLSSLLLFDFFISLALLMFFGVLTWIVWKRKIERRYDEEWKNSVWSRNPALKEAIKQRFESADKKK